MNEETHFAEYDCEVVVEANGLDNLVALGEKLKDASILRLGGIDDLKQIGGLFGGVVEVQKVDLISLILLLSETADNYSNYSLVLLLL